MAGVLGGVDTASTSIGFPIRNMHTQSELGHTGDVLAAVHAIYHTVEHMSNINITSTILKDGHPRLDNASSLSSLPIPRLPKKDKNGNDDKKDKSE
jgi:hypothetical protein